MALPRRLRASCGDILGDRWIPGGFGLASFSDPALEDGFLAKQVQEVSRFFAHAFSLQVVAAVLSVIRSWGSWTSCIQAILSGDSCLEVLCMVRGLLLLTAFLALRRESSRFCSPRTLLFAASGVLAIVLTTLMIDRPGDEVTWHDGLLFPTRQFRNECQTTLDGMECEGFKRIESGGSVGQAVSGRVLLVHWFLVLSGLLSSIPVRCFASSLLPLLTVVPVLCTSTQTFEWWVWLLSALTALIASAHAERHKRFLFLVTSSLQGEKIDQPSLQKDEKRDADLGLEAASNLLLRRLWQNAQLQSAAYELFDAVVSVDVSPERDGKTRFAEASEHENRRLASMLVDDSGSSADVLGNLQGGCLEDFLLPDASENWRRYVEHRLTDRDTELDNSLGQHHAASPRPSASSSVMRLQLTGSRRKELLGLLSPPASPGALALLCLRSVSQESSSDNNTPRSGASVDCGIFGGGALASRAGTSTCSEPQVLSADHSDCSSCEGADAQLDGLPPTSSCENADSQLMDCLPPTACVWAQGAATPTPLSDVKLGMKVLTVDPQRSPSINFDPVKKISFVAEEEPAKEGETESQDRWLRISLSDGSEVVTTATHPMWPEGTYVSSGYTLGALKAEDLVPGVDSLVSLSARRVIVKHVTTVPREVAPAGRVALELGWDSAPKDGVERSRRALFLTLPQDGANPSHGGCFVGVGDSSIQPASNRFDALEEQEGDTVSLTVSTRSSTSHPSTAFGTEVVYGEGGKEDVEIILGNLDEASGWKRDRATGQWMRCTEGEVVREVRLSDIRSLPRNAENEWLSFGSIGHTLKGEQCKVCVFNRKNGVACRNGFNCTFCHAWHQPYVRPRRPDKRRGASRASSVVDESEFAEERAGGRADPGLGQIREEAPTQEPWYVNMPAPPGAAPAAPGGSQAPTRIVSGRFSA